VSAYTRAHGTSYGEPHSFWSGAAKGAVFGAILVAVPRPMRRWMLTMLALVIASIYTVQSPHEWWTPESGVEYGYGGNFLGYEVPGGYRFPWYCVAIIVALVFWGIFGYVRAWRLCQQLRAVGDTPVERLKARMSSRVLIAVDGTQRPPQRPTGPSQRPTAPPPAPRPRPAPSSPYQSPMGSTLPALYVPTYSGPAKPVQRIETTLGGTTIHDHRSVDPEDL
jgi:hypothetical protein